MRDNELNSQYLLWVTLKQKYLFLSKNIYIFTIYIINSVSMLEDFLPGGKCFHAKSLASPYL